MNVFSLILVNLGRNKRRTILTALSIALAFFLFATLRSVLTTLAKASEVGSESRLVVLNKTGLTFPVRMAQVPRLQATEGIKSVSWSNWFGGIYASKPNDFFANFAIDGATFLPMYPEIPCRRSRHCARRQGTDGKVRLEAGAERDPAGHYFRW